MLCILYTAIFTVMWKNGIFMPNIAVNKEIILLLLLLLLLLYNNYSPLAYEVAASALLDAAMAAVDLHLVSGAHPRVL